MKPTDLIVVGAGSAGCVLAHRLAREFRCRITLVEPPAKWAPAIDQQRPARWLRLLESDEDWNLATKASPRLAGRAIVWPRGRGLGGSSRINAMIWFPPTARDWNRLQATGGQRWNTDELTAAYQDVRNQVMPEPPRWLSEASLRFIEAARNYPDAEPMVYQRVNRQGRRWNPATLLDDQETANRIEIVREVVDRIQWHDDRAAGVVLRTGSSEIELGASKGVVLCAGAIATPLILMRSGIGPRETLVRHGIDVRHDQPRLGENLQDHLVMPVIFETGARQPFRDCATTRDLVRWQALGTGPIASNIAECGGLFDDGKFQIHVTPTHYLTFPALDTPPAMTIAVNVTQPESRGRITIGSRHPGAAPEIITEYLQAKTDLAAIIQGVRVVRSIASSAPLAGWITRESLPGPKRESEESIARSISRYAQTLYHPAGTCVAGESRDTVVSPEFRVRGCQRLWVSDASVFPTISLGNPNALVMTLARLAAERIGAVIA